MKTKTPLLIVITLFLAAVWLGLKPTEAQTSTQGQLAVDVELKSATTSANTINNCQSVTFIFRSSFTGTVGGVAFTAADVPLTIRAEHGSVLRAIPYTVTAGTLAIVEVH